MDQRYMRELSDLDAFDLRILMALQENGRPTNQELGERVGLSASQCSRRRINLEAAGLIRGYRADLAAERVGFRLLVFVQVTLATHSGDNAEKFRKLVARLDQVQEAYATSGDTDYFLKIVVPDLKDLSVLLNEILLPHESVARVRSSIVLDRLKETAWLPLRSLVEGTAR
jgi:DNA-binding Lrp family transcriptional regulator